jgi:hypothetical protein
VSAAFVIEKGVPFPGPQGRGLFGAVRRMEVGDSIFVADGKQNTVSATGSAIGRRTGRKFMTRKVEGGIRIWRVS